MALDFFKTELSRTQDRFNQTFGSAVVQNIRTRQRVILAIIHLGLLEKKIATVTNKESVRSQIRRFVKTTRTLNIIFNEMERSRHVEQTSTENLGRDPQPLRDRARVA